MQIFEYVVVLTSIVIGLAVTQILRGVASVIQHPKDPRVYWVHLVWALYVFLTSVFWWWWEFRLGEIEVWTFQLYLFVVLYAVLIYLLSALLFPEDLSGYDGYRDYFYERRAWFFGILGLAIATDVVDSWLKGPAHFEALGLLYIVVASSQILLCAVAMVTRRPRYHAAFALILVAYQLSWAVRAYETVS